MTPYGGSATTYTVAANSTGNNLSYNITYGSTVKVDIPGASYTGNILNRKYQYTTCTISHNNSSSTVKNIEETLFGKYSKDASHTINPVLSAITITLTQNTG